MKRLFFILVIIFFLTRFINLSQLPIFNDEAFFIHATRQIVANPSHNLFFNFSDGKEPFFFWLYSLPVAIFPDALLGTRIFTGLLGLLGLWYFFKISKKVLSQVGQIIACGLYIFSPFLLFYQRVAMQETLLTTLLIIAVYYLLENKKILTGVFMGLALLTKTTSLAFIIFLLPIIVYRRNFLTIFTALIIYLPIFFGLQNVISHNSSYIGVIPLSLIVTNFKQAASWLIGYQGILGVFGLIGPVMIESAVAKIFFPRYFLFVVPFILLSTTFFLDKIKHQSLKVLIFLAVLVPNLFLCLQIIFDIPNAKLPYIERWQYLESWPSGYGIKEVADFLRQQNARKIIVEDIMVTRYGLAYYYPQGEYKTDGESNYYVFDFIQERPKDPSLILKFSYPKVGNKEKIWVYQKL